jgi:hypothetical protein
MADQAITPSWLEQPDLWDEVQLGGDRLPGICEVDPEIGRKIDARKGAGADGANVVDKGFDLGKFTITVVLWKEAHHAAWETLLPKILPRRRVTDRQALEVVNPSVNQLGINAVYVTKVSGLRKGSVKGTRTATITCIEYAPPTGKKKSRTRRPDMVITQGDIDQAEQQNERNRTGARDLATFLRRASAPHRTGAEEP